jgi:ferredoxin
VGEPATYRVTFEFPDGPTTIEVRHDEFILTAARAAGLTLPSLCEQGWCITCAARVLEGIVDQTASRRYYPADRAAGFALLCTGKPRSDLRLRPGATEAMRAHRDAHRLPVPRGTRSTLKPKRA